MKFNKFLTGLSILTISVWMWSCNNQTSAPTAPDVPPVAGLQNGTTLTTQTGANVMSFTVNGGTCSRNYANKPCASVTICNPGTNVCQTVNDILVDTGSYGLRVFKSAIPNLSLNPVISKQGGALSECVEFADGSSDWGPVQTADVKLGNEPAVTVPIQVIDPSYGSVPAGCGTVEASADVAKLNGVLGVGLYAEDCGARCNGTHSSNGRYFTCTGGNSGVGSGSISCVGGSTNALTDQVQNPVSALPVDNNGVIVQLPVIPSPGANGVPGYLIFGLNTQSNNVTSPAAKLYYADTDGNFKATFNNTTYPAFLDTGSNGLFFASSSTTPNCTDAADQGWLCPSGVVNLSAVTTGVDPNHASNITTGTVNFQVANATLLFNSGTRAFSDLGGDGGPQQFDFGLPFYFGRNVAVGIDGKSAQGLGTGPYWVY